MEDWHRDAAAIARIEAARQRALMDARRRGERVDASQGGRWKGAPLANWSWHPSEKDARGKREEFTVVQLLHAEDLVMESRAMQHCVWTYASKCISGRASIWSLRRNADGATKRLLTIELDAQNRTVADPRLRQPPRPCRRAQDSRTLGPRRAVSGCSETGPCEEG